MHRTLLLSLILSTLIILLSISSLICLVPDGGLDATMVGVAGGALRRLIRSSWSALGQLGISHGFGLGRKLMRARSFFLFLVSWKI